MSVLLALPLQIPAHAADDQDIQKYVNVGKEEILEKMVVALWEDAKELQNQNDDKGAAAERFLAVRSLTLTTYFNLTPMVPAKDDMAFRGNAMAMRRVAEDMLSPEHLEESKKQFISPAGFANYIHPLVDPGSFLLSTDDPRTQEERDRADFLDGKPVSPEFAARLSAAHKALTADDYDGKPVDSLRGDIKQAMLISVEDPASAIVNLDQIPAADLALMKGLGLSDRYILLNTGIMHNPTTKTAYLYHPQDAKGTLLLHRIP